MEWPEVFISVIQEDSHNLLVALTLLNNIITKPWQ